MAATQDSKARVELGEIEQFDKSGLNHADTQVKSGAVDGEYKCTVILHYVNNSIGSEMCRAMKKKKTRMAKIPNL